MADASRIEWTDATWNPIVGCSVVSPGCTHCYAMKMAARIEAMQPGSHYAGTTTPTKGGPVWTGRVVENRRALFQPLDWKRGRRIFVNSMGDLFHPGVTDQQILDVFTVMAAAPQHEYQVLTKRHDRMRKFVERQDLLNDIYVNWYNVSGGPREVEGWPLRNVLLGVSVEDQRRADDRRRGLLHVARAGWRTFVSYEPALGAVDWSGWEFLSWLISGGESGPHARPSHPDWHRAARDYCAAHGIPYFFKQWGEWLDEQIATAQSCAPGPEMFDRFGTPKGPRWRPYEATDRNGGAMIRVGKRAAGRLLDGVLHDARPTLTATLEAAYP